MLKINNLHAYYGKSHVLHGVDFAVQPGEIVALLGRNGVGKSLLAQLLAGRSTSAMFSWMPSKASILKPHQSAHSAPQTPSAASRSAIL